MIFDYSINLSSFLRRLLPPVLRKPNQSAWLKALLSPLGTLNTQLLLFVNNSRYLANVSGQTLSLESYLNDTFDNTLRRINIIHNQAVSEYDYYKSEGQTPDYDYWISESQGARYLKYKGEDSSGITESFEVLAPISINGQDNQIKANIEKYKIGAVTYTITYN